jgi:RNA-binding protein
MKQVHNIRIRTIETNKTAAKETLDQLLTAANIERKDADITISEDEEGLAVGQLWIERQPPIKKILSLLKTQLPAAQQQRIKENPAHYLDLATHSFLRLDKEAFAEGKYVLKDAGSCIHVRINIAAFPATKENAAHVLAEIFSQQ